MMNTDEAKSWAQALTVYAVAASNLVEREPYDARTQLLCAIRCAGNAYGALGRGTGQAGTDGHYDARIGDELEALAQQLAAGERAKAVLP